MARCAIGLLALFVISSDGFSDEPEIETVKDADLKPVFLADGWKRWEGVGDPEWERVTALDATGGQAWIGTTSRLLWRDNGMWKQASPAGTQITGVAQDESGNVWLSTADGIRWLTPSDEGWEKREYRTYYEGHPAFVSGVYLPGDDSERIWGYVDDIYLPTQETSYAPFVISTEHGLYSSIRGNKGGGWHQFLPHYWGANSPWLDLTELFPRRRPTCMTEDVAGNLWVGSAWDGFVRFNAHARKYSDRPAAQNQKDETEFSRFGAQELGMAFDRVTDLFASPGGGIWAILKTGKRSVVVKYDGTSWETWLVPEKLGPATAVVEIEKNRVYLAGGRSLLDVDWVTKSVQEVEGPESVRMLIRLSDGTVFAASSRAIYERPATPVEEP